MAGLAGLGLRRSASARPRRRVLKSRYLAAAVTILLGLSTYLAPNAWGFILVQASPSFPDTVVGQTFPASLGIANFSTPPESIQFPVLNIGDIDLYPSCTTPTTDCAGGTAEAGVYALSATGVGQSIPPGNPTCEGTWHRAQHR